MKSLYIAIAALTIATPAFAQDHTNTNTNTATSTAVTHVTDNRGTSYPVNTAIAPSMVTAHGCAIGGGAGFQGPGFGASLGGAKEGANCEARAATQMAIALAERGMIHPGVAVQTACQHSDFREGMRYAGTPCTKDRQTVARTSTRSDQPTNSRRALVNGHVPANR